MKSLKSLLFLAIFTMMISIVFVSPAEGATNTWTGAVGNNWGNVGNWTLARLPKISDKFYIGDTGSPGIYLNVDGLGADESRLCLTASDVTCLYSDSKHLEIDGDSRIAQDDLHGGTLYAGSLSIAEDANCNLDITEGTMRLNGNKVGIINELYSDGRLTAYGGDGDIVVTTDENYTYVVAGTPVANPGEDNNIRANLQTAINNSSPGDILILPEGNFKFDRSISVAAGDLPLTILGKGKNKTLLYRSVDSTEYMIRFTGTGSQTVEISGIWFKGMQPSRNDEDGLSQTYDLGLQFLYCNPIVHHCGFEWFGSSAVYVKHYDTAGKGLICDNEFRDNWKFLLDEEGGTEQDATFGYGVVVYGQKSQWISNAYPGGANFLFVEGNYFTRHRHSIAANNGALYVFRNNRVMDNDFCHAVDAHGGDGTSSDYGTRFYEIYDNDIICSGNEGTDAIMLRGGEGVVFGNYIENQDTGVRLHCEVVASYPVYYQIGWASGVTYGSSHTGTNPSTYGNGDVFIWSNSYSDVSTNVTSGSGLVSLNRDYHTVARPSYSSYTYPHPSRPAGYTYDLTGDVTVDGDSDGLDMLEEFLWLTDPTDSDTDGDGDSDGYEVDHGADPLVPGCLLCDLDDSKIIDYNDVNILGSHWLVSDCNFPDWCQGADISHDGNVNFVDFSKLAKYWLEPY